MSKRDIRAVLKTLEELPTASPSDEVPNDQVIGPGERQCPLCGLPMTFESERGVSVDVCEKDGLRLDRGDVVLAKMNKGRLRPGQFQLKTLFQATLVVAIVFSIPRSAGWSFAWFFGFLQFIAFLLAPLVALVVTSSFPWLRPRYRILLAAACLALAIVPFLGYVAWVGKAHEIPEVLIPASFIWLGQVFCIWGVWYSLFRERADRRRVIGRPKSRARRVEINQRKAMP